MKLTPVTHVGRFISVDGRTVVHISRSRQGQGLDAYCDPPVIEDETEVWGTCLDEHRDTFHEIGLLPEVLQTIAPQQMVAAAAMASPRRFAEMVASAHDLGGVFYVASRAIWAVSDHIADAKRFCSIEVDEQTMSFHALLPLKLFEEQSEVPGVYAICYSLSDFKIKSRTLVEEYPKRSRTTCST
jgi:hypothetical protein